MLPGAVAGNGTCKMTRQTLINNIKLTLRNHGFEEDRYGNLKRKATQGSHGRVVRYKFKDLALRKEVLTQGGEWVRVASAYYKNLSINADGKIVGLKRAR